MAFRTRVGAFIGSTAGPNLTLDSNNTEKYFPLFVVTDWVLVGNRPEILGQEAMDRILTELDPYLSVFGIGNTSLPRRVVKAIENAGLVLQHRPATGEGGLGDVGVGAANGLSLVSTVVEDDTLYVMHMGNCRAMLARNGGFNQINKNHYTLHERRPDSMESATELDPDRALGLSRTPKVEVTKLTLQDGDRILLSNEALFDTLSKMHIERILGAESDPQAAVDQLVEAYGECRDDRELEALLIQFHRTGAKPGPAPPYRAALSVAVAAALWGIGYLLLHLLLRSVNPASLWILTTLSLWTGVVFFLFMTFAGRPRITKKEADYRLFGGVTASVAAALIMIFIGVRIFQPPPSPSQVDRTGFDAQDLLGESATKPSFETRLEEKTDDSASTLASFGRVFSGARSDGGGELIYSGSVVTDQMKVPYALALDSESMIFTIDDKTAGLLQVNPATGEIVEINTDKRLVFPTDIVEMDGFLFVVDFSRRSNRVYKFDKSGKMLMELGGGAVTLSNPKAAAHDARGNLYICDRGNNRILKFDPRGELISSIRLSRDYLEPNGITVDTLGDVWVTLKASGKLIRIVNDETVEEVSLRGSDGRRYALSLPGGLDADMGDRLFIADTGKRRVVVTDRTGRVLRLLEDAELPGILDHPPKGVRVDPSGAYLYVVGGNTNNYNPADDARTRGIIWKVRI